jgi:hypothetical protein
MKASDAGWCTLHKRVLFLTFLKGNARYMHEMTLRCEYLAIF